MTKPEIDLPSLEQIIDIVHTDRASRAEIGAYIGGLKESYDGPGRAHHNFTHVQEMTRELLRYEDQVDNKRLVTWATLLHDVVYDPQAAPGVNEALSAEQGARDLPAFLPDEEVAAVVAYTLATADHVDDDSDSDLQLFLDSDLWILGSPEDRYDRYALDIRQEYDHVDSAMYQVGRIAVLEKLAARVDGKYVFQTDVFRDDYEEQAQENITREIEKLRSGVAEL